MNATGSLCPIEPPSQYPSSQISFHTFASPKNPGDERTLLISNSYIRLSPCLFRGLIIASYLALVSIMLRTYKGCTPFCLTIIYYRYYHEPLQVIQNKRLSCSSTVHLCVMTYLLCFVHQRITDLARYALYI